MSVTVNLREVGSDLTDENRKETVEIDLASIPSASSSSSGGNTGVNAGALLDLVCDTVGLAERSGEFALWLVVEDDGMRDPQFFIIISSLDCYPTCLSFNLITISLP